MLSAGKTIWCTFDPPYRHKKISGHPTIDHRELVSLLLKARYPWVLSEEEDPIYHPLGEPVARFTVTRTLKFAPGTTIKREKAVECLWSNFEVAPELQAISEGIKRMPKIDTADLLQSLEKERDDIDAAIRALNRTIVRNFAPTTAKRSPRSRTTTARKKRRSLTEAERAALSAKLKKVWAKRKAAAKKG